MECDRRVVVLIDMDCFYCQVEEKLDPQLRGKPIAVVQYNPWKGGGIIAVNYPARAMGVKRGMRGDEAKVKCPDIQLPSVPCGRGKANISKYRDAGIDVAKVLQRFTPLLERASIDEAYMDITEVVEKRLKATGVAGITSSVLENTYALGYESISEMLSEVVGDCSPEHPEHPEYDHDNALMMLMGAVVVNEIRAAVLKDTGFECSAGISHNKTLAKLVCAMHKPNKQTVLPHHAVSTLYHTLPIRKVKQLGGKFGEAVCARLRLQTLGELAAFAERDLQEAFDDKNGSWLYKIARGVDTEPVQAKFHPKSIGCCKQFPGKNALVDLHSLRKWLTDLADEIEERLERDAVEVARTPRQLVLSYQASAPAAAASAAPVSCSRSYNFLSDDQLCASFYSSKALQLLLDSLEGSKPAANEENRPLKMHIKFLGISVGKFEEHDAKKVKTIDDFFSAGPSKPKEELTGNKEESDVKRNKVEQKLREKSTIFEKFFQSYETKGETNKSAKGSTDTSKSSNDSVNSTDERTQSPILTGAKLFTNTSTSNKINPNNRHKAGSPTIPELTMDLHNQESFFQRFLNKQINGRLTPTNTNTTQYPESPKPKDQPPTAVCETKECADESNDSDYSGSTINMEINKSLTLADNRDEDKQRISNTRSLLSTSLKLDMDSDSETKSEDNVNEVDTSEADPERETPTQSKRNSNSSDVASNRDIEKKKILNAENEVSTNNNVLQNNVINDDLIKLISERLLNDKSDVHNKRDEVMCPECSRRVPISEIETHSDFHLAKKLRDEERAELRKITTGNIKTASKENNSTVNTERKINKNTLEGYSKTMDKFLHKVSDIATETCAECGRKIAVAKFGEHLDFHEAQKLSRLINKRPSDLVENVCNVTSHKKAKVMPPKSAKKTLQTLDSYFR